MTGMESSVIIIIIIIIIILAVLRYFCTRVCVWLYVSCIRVSYKIASVVHILLTNIVEDELIMIFEWRCALFVLL